MKFLGEGEWKRKKYGPEYRRQSRKLHIGIDAKTLQIRAIQLTTNNVSDSQVLGDLLNQIPQDEQIDSVYTDGAYDTKQCREVIADRQAHAVFPPRKNAKPWKDTKSSSLDRNELLRTVNLGSSASQAGHYGKNQAIIGEVWLKLRCTALNY